MNSTKLSEMDSIDSLLSLSFCLRAELVGDGQRLNDCGLTANHSHACAHRSNTTAGRERQTGQRSRCVLFVGFESCLNCTPLIKGGGCVIGGCRDCRDWVRDCLTCGFWLVRGWRVVCVVVVCGEGA